MCLGNTSKRFSDDQSRRGSSCSSTAAPRSQPNHPRPPAFASHIQTPVNHCGRSSQGIARGTERRLQEGTPPCPCCLIHPDSHARFNQNHHWRRKSGRSTLWAEIDSVEPFWIARPPRCRSLRTCTIRYEGPYFRNKKKKVPSEEGYLFCSFSFIASCTDVVLAKEDNACGERGERLRKGKLDTSDGIGGAEG